MMKYLYFYLAIGVVATLAMFVVNRLRSPREDLRSDLLSSIQPERKTGWYWMSSKVFGSMLAAVFAILAWPIVLYMNIKSARLSKEREKIEEADRVEFEVQRAHLLDALNIEEIEAREMVHDPLGAVPHIPFGHLNDAWRQYVEKISDGDQSWSFQARFGKPRNTTSDYAGYAILRQDNIAAFFIASRNPVDE